MKTFFTLVIGITLLGVSSFATGSKKSTEYFICHFTDTISSVEVSELNELGFLIFNTDKKNHVLYVKGKQQCKFPAQLKDKMKKLVKVDQHGNRINLVENAYHSPELLKLFFNFI